MDSEWTCPPSLQDTCLDNNPVLCQVIQERKAAVPGGTLVFPPLPRRSTSGNHADHPATSAAAHRSSTGGESVDPRGGVWHMQPETRDQTFSPHTQASSQGPSSISGLVQDVCDELLADASSGPLVPGGLLRYHSLHTAPPPPPTPPPPLSLHHTLGEQIA